MQVTPPGRKARSWGLLFCPVTGTWALGDRRSGPRRTARATEGAGKEEEVSRCAELAPPVPEVAPGAGLMVVARPCSTEASSRRLFAPSARTH